METSALSGDNIEKAFNELIEQIYENNCEDIESGVSVDVVDKGVNLNDEKKADNGIMQKCCPQQS